MEELVSSIQSFFQRRNIECDFIAADKSKDIITTLASKFSFDLRQRWLWNGIKPTVAANYGDGEEGTHVLDKFLNIFDDTLTIAIADDEFFPWPLFVFPKQFLVELLEENVHFEFFIFDSSLKNVLFDTHHKSILIFNADLRE